MSTQIISNESGHFASSMYGQEWAGPDGDRLTVALSLLKSVQPGRINVDAFSSNLEFEPSVSIQEIIEASTDWQTDEEASQHLHSHESSYLVAITNSEEIPTWPEFNSVEHSLEMKDKLSIEWKEEIAGVSQGAYVSQAQHTISTPSRLGLMAQVDNGKMVWPPRQLNSKGERIDAATTHLSEKASILTWTRLSAAGAPSEFSRRAPILDGVATVLVAFDEGPKGVFMLADDEKGTPEIDGKVRFEIRRLYGQDNMIHYGLKAVLTKS